jgi:hypothetical protein
MALGGTEHWSRGLVWTNSSETVAASTATVAGSSYKAGFLRDADGRIVTSAGPGSYVAGFLRDANGALVVTAGVSTPKLYPFA